MLQNLTTISQCQVQLMKKLKRMVLILLIPLNKQRLQLLKEQVIFLQSSTQLLLPQQKVQVISHQNLTQLPQEQFNQRNQKMLQLQVMPLSQPLLHNQLQLNQLPQILRSQLLPTPLSQLLQLLKQQTNQLLQTSLRCKRTSLPMDMLISQLLRLQKPKRILKINQLKIPLKHQRKRREKEKRRRMELRKELLMPQRLKLLKPQLLLQKLARITMLKSKIKSQL